MTTGCPECEVSPWWHLFDAGAYATRDRCGDWPGWLVWVWATAAVLTCAVYARVAVKYARRSYAGRGTGYPWRAALAFAALFVGCAVVHLEVVASFHWPVYRAFVWWEVVSLGFAVLGVYGLQRLLLWHDGQGEEVDRLRARAEADALEIRRLRHDVRNKEAAVSLADGLAAMKEGQAAALEKEVAELRVRLGGVP